MDVCYTNSRKFRDNHLRVRGFLVDSILEVIELTPRHDLVEYRLDTGLDKFLSLRKHTEHAAVVEWHALGLDLARRVAFGGDARTSEIPSEYFSTLLADCRLDANAEAAYREAWPCFSSSCEDDDSGQFDWLPDQREQVIAWITRLRSLVGHAFFSTKHGRFGLATPGCKPGDRVCAFYGADPLHILRWPVSADDADATHGEGPAEFCGSAYIPHLMEPYQSDAARLAPDEIFVIR